jgi:hypothetical protein
MLKREEETVFCKVAIIYLSLLYNTPHDTITHRSFEQSLFLGYRHQPTGCLVIQKVDHRTDHPLWQPPRNKANKGILWG